MNLIKDKLYNIKSDRDQTELHEEAVCRIVSEFSSKNILEGRLILVMVIISNSNQQGKVLGIAPQFYKITEL